MERLHFIPPSFARATLVAAILVAAILVASAPAEPSPEPEKYGGRMALLPFENSTGRLKAIRMVDSCLTETLVRQGFSLMPDSALRPLFRAHRIRSVGSIGREGAEILRREAGIAFIILGSIDLFEEEGIPEVALSVRILDARTLRIVWAGSGAGSGQDGTWLFGLGKTSDMGVLTRKVVDRMLAPLTSCFPDRCVIGTTGYTVAIIPFDNYSGDVHAGTIVTNVLLTRLVSLNMDVLEPGLLEETLSRRQVTPRGEIDRETLKEIRRDFGANLVVTGAVDQFQPGRGDVLAANPELEMSIRFVRAGKGSVAGIRAGQIAGDQQDIVFGLGREYSMGRLVQRHLDDLLDFPALIQLTLPEDR